MNNDPLSTTASVFGSQGWSLYTGLIVTYKLAYKSRNLNKILPIIFQFNLYAGRLIRDNYIRYLKISFFSVVAGMNVKRIPNVRSLARAIVHALVRKTMLKHLGNHPLLTSSLLRHLIVQSNLVLTITVITNSRP